MSGGREPVRRRYSSLAKPAFVLTKGADGYTLEWEGRPGLVFGPFTLLELHLLRRSLENEIADG